MKLFSPIAILLGTILIALAIEHNIIQGSHYQIVRLTDGRIARLDQRTGAIAYCSVRTTDAERVIRCGER